MNIRRALAVALPCLLGACSLDEVAGPPAWFAEEAAERGIDFHHVSGFSERYLLPEITGSGAALADLDGDGDLDAYLVQAGSLASPSNAVDRVYFNRGGGRFEPGAVPPDADGYGMGVAAGDYDNDGDVDLYVTNVGAERVVAERWPRPLPERRRGGRSS